MSQKTYISPDRTASHMLNNAQLNVRGSDHYFIDWAMGVYRGMSFTNVNPTAMNLVYHGAFKWMHEEHAGR